MGENNYRGQNYSKGTNKNAARMKIRRISIAAPFIFGFRSSVIAVSAMTITMGALMNLASTADCPITSAPTMLIDCITLE